VDRRTLLAGAGGLLLAPLAAEAQPKTHRLGFLSISGGGGADLRRALLDSLRERG
jgi:hypothetical protein